MTRTRAAARTHVLSAWLAALLPLLSACGKASDPPLHLELGEVSSHDDGQVALSVAGDALPDGARGELALDGLWLEALGQPTRARRSFPCSVSPRGELVVARAALGGPSLPLIFDGTLSVSLSDPAGRPSLGGPERAHFVLDGESGSASARVALLRRVQAAREALGVELERADTGLAVRGLATGGQLARAGVKVGDVLARQGEVPLLAESALVAAQASGARELVVQRGGRELRLTLDEGAARQHVPASSLWLIAGLFAAAALLLPTRAALRRVDRTLVITALATAGAACVLGPRLPLTPLLPVLLAELYALRGVRSRAAALRCLADAAASALALSACVLAQGASASADPLPGVLASPGLWLALVALTVPAGAASRLLARVRSGAAAAAWGIAAAGLQGGLALPFTACAALLALAALELDPFAFGARFSTWERSLTAMAAVLACGLTPRLAAPLPALTLISSALLGIALGVVVRAAQRAIASARAGEASGDASMCEGVR